MLARAAGDRLSSRSSRRACSAGRGASLWQPYRDLVKLLRKGTVQSDTASPFFRAVPVLVLAATVTAAAMVPVLWAPADPRPPASGRRDPAAGAAGAGALPAAPIGALDAGGALRRHGRLARDDGRPAGRAGPDAGGLLGGGRGRHHRSGRTGHAARHAAALSWQAPDLLALFAMLILILAETGRIPVDNPDTHLELTMLHEGMLLEHSGPGLACIVLATHTKQLVHPDPGRGAVLPAGPGPGHRRRPSSRWRWRPSRSRCSALATVPGPGRVLLREAALLPGARSSWGWGFVCAFLALALRML